MTTPPVPQWAVDAAKALALADRDALNCERVLSMSEAARIIAAHAPHGNEDGARLDWLEELRAGVEYNDRIAAFTVQRYQQVCGCIGDGQTIRAAIDAARNKTP